MRAAVRQCARARAGSLTIFFCGTGRVSNLFPRPRQKTPSHPPSPPPPTCPSPSFLLSTLVLTINIQLVLVTCLTLTLYTYFRSGSLGSALVVSSKEKQIPQRTLRVRLPFRGLQRTSFFPVYLPSSASLLRKGLITLGIQQSLTVLVGFIFLFPYILPWRTSSPVRWQAVMQSGEEAAK
jgi:hypothetical protein